MSSSQLNMSVDVGRQARIVVLGGINMDLIATTPRLANPGETVIGDTFYTAPGGKGGNQAVAASRMGGRVSMIGRVGTDIFGPILLKELQGYGVDVEGVATDSEHSSGIAVILLNAERQNHIVQILGANMQCDDGQLAVARRFLNGADVFMLQLEIPHAVSLAAAKEAKRLRAGVEKAIGGDDPADRKAEAEAIVAALGIMVKALGDRDTATNARDTQQRAVDRQMTSAGFRDHDEVRAAAHPEEEFNMEITTGMSAPPMGMITKTPSTRARAMNVQKYVTWGSRTNITISATVATAKTRFSRCWPGKVTGLPDTNPWSLVNATTEPLKVIAPMIAPRAISMRLARWIWPSASVMPYDAGLSIAAAATSTAAIPTKL